MVSALFSGPPVLISPESAGGIKSGARTGLSTLVCGFVFGFATYLYPLFAAIPAAATAPLLLMIGVLLFQNIKRVDWNNLTEAVPAYVLLFFIPFTYNILKGVIIGYVIYLCLNLNLESFHSVSDVTNYYVKWWGQVINGEQALLPALSNVSLPRNFSMSRFNSSSNISSNSNIITSNLRGDNLSDLEGGGDSEMAPPRQKQHQQEQLGTKDLQLEHRDHDNKDHVDVGKTENFAL